MAAGLNKYKSSASWAFGSLAFLLVGWVLCFHRGGGQGEPQAEEDDEVTYVQSGWAAVGRRVGVPGKLDQTQDEDTEQMNQIYLLIIFK